MTFGPQNEEYDVGIHQAQEPQDVLWQNIGLSTHKLLIRKCITVISTILVLGASFGVVYGLSTVQAKNQSNQYISFLISIVIVIFNVIINIVLRLFTSYQKNPSFTAYESSYAFKSIFAQMVNTIIIPILVNRFLKKQNYLYTKSGLADDIFLLGLTNAFLSPLLKLFDVEYLFRKYFLVWYYSRPEQKFRIDQIQLNKIYELMLFESGYEYIYVISLYLWTSFFMSLQPVIIAFSIAGLVMNYWAQKYCLFHRCKRPVPGTRTLYNVMVQFVYAGGLFYSLGSLTFINLLPKDVLNTDPKFVLVANILSVVFGALSLFIPYSYIYDRWIDIKQEAPDCFYEKQRIFFPSQYDRVNPVTSDKAIEQYFVYVNAKKQEIQKKIGQNKLDTEIAELFSKLSQQGRNFYTRTRQEMVPYLASIGGAFSNLFVPQIQTISPSQIENYLLADNFEKVAKMSQKIDINQEKGNIEGQNKLNFARQPDEENILQTVFRKALAMLQMKQLNKRSAKNPQNQYSLERLNNDELIFDGGRVNNNKKPVQEHPQSQVNINVSSSLWETVAAAIRQQVPQHENPIINPLNYTSSPYNPISLQNFKIQNNTIYSMNRLQSETGQSYKNINEAVRKSKKSLKTISHE